MNRSLITVLVSVALAALATIPLLAQTAPMADTVSPQGNAASIFAPLTLGPAPSQTRLADGAPGPKYWQNRADYNLQAVLDTGTHTIRGSMTVRYTNNSPDTLRTLWFQTEQDPDEVIQRFVQSVNGQFVPVTLENHDTETKITLAAPIDPGAATTLQVAWHYDKFHGGRTAYQGALYEIAQWYPRLNVYDDVKGWNTEPYTTGAEFFLEYGDYALSVTVPAGYIVAATGTLDNPRDVLTPTEIARLAVAARSDTVVHVIAGTELTGGAIRPKQDGMLTWKFHANNVRDVVWCAAPDFQWDATSWHGVLAQSYYQPNAVSVWDEAADMARMSIEEYSTRWYPYPYPQVSVVEGPVSGMEYPMLSMENMDQSHRSLYSVITHEVGHNWFPMIVGSNERVHTWMDEGFNNFINSFSEARRYPQSGDQAAHIRAKPIAWDQAVLENGTVIGNALPQYRKTAQTLQVLRYDVMGPARFDTGFRTYIHEWAYKHPTPVDFFRSMATAYGHNLDWFWRECFLEALSLDQSVDSVRQTVQGHDTHVIVTYGNHTRMVMPLLVRFTFADGTTKDVTYPADIWRANPTAYTADYTFSGRTVRRIELDPNLHLPDTQRANNVWTASDPSR